MKKAIILGASSGIGKGVAQLLVINKYKVGITGRRTDLLEKIKQENPDFIIKSFDVSDTKSTIDNLEELTAELGGLDLLIISSGTGDLNENLNFDTEKRTIDTNAIGFTNAACWAFNFFRKQKYGHIAAITSVAGLRGNRQAPSYNATKAYQINYLEALRQKAKHLKMPIIITDIRPGFVKTDMAKGDGQFWTATVDKASKQIYKAIKAKKQVVYITGRWQLLGIILKLIPRFVYNKL
ncbi:MAG: SDR family NAD(P)-dependent oxidoreductase [Bacteroidales bacterium]|nr:SDR family NAD(P)-dependent oxidoreductase [Bacteroidales bacterium]